MRVVEPPWRSQETLESLVGRLSFMQSERYGTNGRRNFSIVGGRGKGGQIQGIESLDAVSIFANLCVNIAIDSIFFDHWKSIMGRLPPVAKFSLAVRKNSM